MPTLIDSHSHIDVTEFDADRTAVMERARAAGVSDQVVPAISAAGWPALRELCAQTQGLHPAYGLHPVYLGEHEPAHLDELETWIARERPVAIGECGLDFHVEGIDRDLQRRYFQFQLDLARQVDLPVIVHARRAFEEVTTTLRRTGNLRGVVHSFSGSAEQARHLWDIGFFLGIGGPVTYSRATRLRRIVATMPIEFLLLETDSPDQPMAERRGARNEPAWLVDVLRTVAALRGESEDQVAAATTANARRLFGI